MGFVTDIVGEITGANDTADAAKEGSDLQYRASMAGVDEHRRQYDKMVELMAPYVNAGYGALGSQQNLLGLNGNAAQQNAINAIQNSAAFQSALQQGENSILQNASATGGLRGGNTQGALAQYSPQLLNQYIQQQYSNLGGLSGMGQASAAGQANAGQASASNIANLLQQGGAAQAGGVMAEGGAGRQAFGDLLNIGGTVLGASKFLKF